MSIDMGRRSAVPGVLSIAWLVTGVLVAGPRALADIKQEPIADGLTYMHWEDDGVVAHILKTVLKRPNLFIRSLKAEGKETLRTMVARLNRQDERVIGAINGDFFFRDSRAGVPHGVQVSDGKLIFGPRKRSMICFGVKKTPYIAVVYFKGELRLGLSSKALKIDSVNAFPKEFKKRDGILLYTPAFQELEASRYVGIVAAVERITPALQVGDECKGTITTVKPGGTQLAVPKDGCLLYFLGNYALELQGKLRPGIDVRLKIALPPIKGGVPQAIGGGPRLVRAGRVSVGFDKEDFSRLHAAEINGKRHPRSAVGYDKSKTYLYLVMVEGRHKKSRGMTMRELANFMRRLRCYDAMAFDGGGSAALYVLRRGIVSKSIGGGGRVEEREIANSLLISTKRPEQRLKPDVFEGVKGGVPVRDPR